MFVNVEKEGSKENLLLINLPYLEGVLPLESSMVLSALVNAGVTKLSVVLEGALVQDENCEIGCLQRVHSYFNKRFSKHLEKQRGCSIHEI